MADGNKSSLLLWLEDTSIVRKPLSEKHLYFVADARTGAPIEGATVEFFGYRMQRPPAATIKWSGPISPNAPMPTALSFPIPATWFERSSGW